MHDAQLSHYRCQRYCSVTSDPFSRDGIWLQAHQLHHRPRPLNHESFLKTLCCSANISIDNLSVISLTIASSGPSTLFSLRLALAQKTRSTVISALRPSSVNCRFPFSWKYSILFLGLLLLLPHWCTPRHNAFGVLHAILTHVQFCERLFRLFLPWLQTAFHQVLSSCLPRLLPEHPPLNFCYTLCGCFLT